MLKLRYTIILLFLLLQASGLGQTVPITIMTYNTSDDGSNWNTRKPYLSKVIGVVNPDIIVAVEINNSNTDDFLSNVLNADSNTYSKGTFIANTTSPNSNCLYYKTNKFSSASFENTAIPSYLDLTQITQYRDINKFKLTQNGGNTIIIYALHLVADGHPGNSNERAAEVSYLLDYIENNGLATDNYIVLGDFNVDNADESAYKNLLYYPPDLNGYFYDPQNYPPTTFGNWGNSYWGNSLSYSSDGLYVRFDMILMSANVWNGTSGVTYKTGSFTVEGNSSPTSDEITASDHLPAYAIFDFVDNTSPVELEYFVGKIVGESVELHWKTATEVNNYGFEIQRSPDKISWDNIGFVAGNGNSNSPKYYSYKDKFIPDGKIYYRLILEDEDGKFKYSSIVELDNNVSLKPDLFQNYPNPFNPVSTIKYSIPNADFVSLKIYDVLGREVATLVNKKQNAGMHSAIFNGTNLASGIYYYVLKTNNFVLSKKMSLLK